MGLESWLRRRVVRQALQVDISTDRVLEDTPSTLRSPQRCENRTSNRSRALCGGRFPQGSATSTACREHDRDPQGARYAAAEENARQATEAAEHARDTAEQHQRDATAISHFLLPDSSGQ